MISKVRQPVYRGISRLVTTYLDDESGIFYLGLNSPAKRNAVDFDTAHQLFDAFTEFNENKEALIGILHGNGGTFCAGFDLKQLGSFQNKSTEEIDKALEGRAPMVKFRNLYSFSN